MAKAKVALTDEEQAEADETAQVQADEQAKAERKALDAEKEAHRKNVFAFALTKESTAHSIPEADLLKAIQALPEQDRSVAQVSAIAERMGDKAKLAAALAENTVLKAAQGAGGERKPPPLGGGTATLGYKERLKGNQPMPSAEEIDRMTAKYASP